MGTPEPLSVDPELRQRMLVTALRRGRRIRRARRRVVLCTATIVTVVVLVGLGGIYGAHLRRPAGTAAPRPPSTPPATAPAAPAGPAAPRVVASVSLGRTGEPAVTLPGIAARPAIGDGAVWVLARTAVDPLELVGVKGTPPAIFSTIQLATGNAAAAAMGNDPQVAPPVIIGGDAWVVVPGHLLEVNLASGRIMHTAPDHYGTPQLLAAEHGSLWRFENGSAPASSGATTLFPELQRIDLATGAPEESIHLPGGCGGGALVPGPQGLWAETLACGTDSTVDVDLVNPASGRVVRTLSYSVADELSLEAATSSVLWGTEYGPAGTTHGLVGVSPTTGEPVVTSDAPSDAWGLDAGIGSSGLWSAGRSAVALVDPRTGGVTHVIHLPMGTLVDGLAVGSHAVWIRDAAGLVEVQPS